MNTSMTASLRTTRRGRASAANPDTFVDVAEVRRRTGAEVGLTVKEDDVLALMAEGYSNDRIAWRLRVTSRTVESHINRIFTKLGLEADPATHRRVLAVLAYLRAGAAGDQPVLASLSAEPGRRSAGVPSRPATPPPLPQRDYRQGQPDHLRRGLDGSPDRHFGP
jgi:DNA-binding CsgD family transcriptional regulator